MSMFQLNSKTARVGQQKRITNKYRQDKTGKGKVKKKKEFLKAKSHHDPNQPERGRKNIDPHRFLIAEKAGEKKTNLYRWSYCCCCRSKQNTWCRSIDTSAVILYIDKMIERMNEKWKHKQQWLVIIYRAIQTKKNIHTHMRTHNTERRQDEVVVVLLFMYKRMYNTGIPHN